MTNFFYFFLVIFPLALIHLVSEYPSIIRIDNCGLGCGIALGYIFLSVIAILGFITSLVRIRFFIKFLYLFILIILFWVYVGFSFDYEVYYFPAAYIAGFAIGQLVYLTFNRFFPHFYNILWSKAVFRNLIFGVGIFIALISIGSLINYSYLNASSYIFTQSQKTLDTAIKRCDRSAESQECFLEVARRYRNIFNETSCNVISNSPVWPSGWSYGECLNAVAVMENNISLCFGYENIFQDKFKLGDCIAELFKLSKNPPSLCADLPSDEQRKFCQQILKTTE